MNILLCVAGMPHAEPAVSLGAIIACATQSSVTLLHVIRSEEDRADGERFLAAAREMLPDLTVDMRIRRGDPVKQILAEVRGSDYDLTIIGARRGSGLAERLLGSVAQKVVRRIPTSVLVAREVGTSLQCILICSGGKDVADPVIETGARLAEATHAQATLLHITGTTPSMYVGLSMADETVTELLQTDTPIAQHLRHGAEILAQHQVSAKLKLRHGVVSDEIISEARQGDYDLIVMGASGATGKLREWLLRNVTRQIVENALCSVLVVKQG
jgi:nucleotide-binding universal stress UspA family protein